MTMHARFMKRFGAVLSLFLFVLVTASGHAQNARFSGQVTDPQNAAIPHATVDITNQDTGAQRHTETDESGSYTVPYLPAGHYRVVVGAPGFSISAHDLSLGM